MASKLDQWLATANKNTLVFLILAAGIIFIIMSDPPHTLCDTQIEQLKRAQGGFLFRSADKKSRKLISFKQMFEFCSTTPSPGSCYELFSRQRLLVKDLEAISDECLSEALDVTQVNTAVWGVLDLMARSAWGKQPPESYQDKFGWLDAADMALFCDLKRTVVRARGPDSWDRFAEKLFQSLPGARDLPRKDAWERLILSEDCRRYL